ncbi:phage tail protein [Marinobacter sp. BGYM27]|uniref:phage tail protein n=1 Tax=Marinobacter sp. BGYM27 TaxID=2975597 RepID=UPI0021A308C9|nr:phage tail protein [Marinobacter sp. BGYM27]MDG5498976.1 phage tail protein [Marinobacter sp. BGYM27]
MSWWSDNVGGKLSSAWDSLKQGDILGAGEDIFNVAFDAISLGTFSYAKDQARGLFEMPAIPYQDRKRMIKSPAGARQVVYGHCRVGGHAAYIESGGKDKRFINLTLIVAAHQVEQITAVYANGKKVASARSSGNGLMPRVDDGKLNKGADEWYVRCWSAKGDQSAAIIPATSLKDGQYSPPGWTSKHKLLGQAYVHIFCAYADSKFESGLPKFEIELYGKNDLYDPRTGSVGYSNNQALVELDVLRWPRLGNRPDSKIDFDSYVASANVADEVVVAGPGKTEKRYTVNGAFRMETPPPEILQSVAAAGAAYPVRSAGIWGTVPGKYSEPVMDLDESDLIGGLSFQPGPGKKARHNMARGTYVDASQNFETVEFPPIKIGDYISDDLEELERSFEFPWTTSGSMARRLSKIEIERGRYGLSASARFKFRTLRLTPGDRVTLSIAQLGWDKRVFRVDDTDADYNAGVKLRLREDAPEIYEWEEGDALALDPPPPLNLPDGLEISPPENIVVTEELYQTLTRAAIKVRMLIAWSADDVANAYDIQYKLSSTSKWESAGTYWQDNDIEINDVLDAPYNLRLRARNVLGNPSDWVYLDYTVEGKSAPPPDVETLFIQNGNLKWSYSSAPLDLAGFEVRFQNGNRRVWPDATPVTGNIITETQFDVSEFTGTKTFMVRAIDTTGNLSSKPAFLIQDLGDAPLLNVIYDKNEAPAWAGTLTGGLINADNELEATQLGSFYGEPDSVFYGDSDSPFYQDDYARMEYVFGLTVPVQDIGAAITIEVLKNDGQFNERIDYMPPDYTADWLAFPGSVPAQEGVYQFRMVFPQQQGSTPPRITDIIVRLDAEDIEEDFNDIAIAVGGTRLPITKTYRAIKNVMLTLQFDGGSAKSVFVMDRDSELGPLIEAFDGPTSVTGNINAKIKGY